MRIFSIGRRGFAHLFPLEDVDLRIFFIGRRGFAHLFHWKTWICASFSLEDVDLRIFSIGRRGFAHLFPLEDVDLRIFFKMEDVDLRIFFNGRRGFAHLFHWKTWICANALEKQNGDIIFFSHQITRELHSILRSGIILLFFYNRLQSVRLRT